MSRGKKKMTQFENDKRDISCICDDEEEEEEYEDDEEE